MGELHPLEEDIESYLLRLKHYFKANNVKDENQVSVLITVIGPKVLTILVDLVSLDKIDSKSYEPLKNIFEEHFSPHRLLEAKRYTFFSCVQRPNEGIADFVVALKHLSSTCKFGTFLKDAMRDKLICGIQNEVIRQKLLSEEQDFDTTSASALTLEQAEKQTGLFVNPVHMVNKMNTRQFRPNNSSFHRKNKPKTEVGSQKCFRCMNSTYKAAECPYKEFKCHSCKKIVHLSKFCFKSKAF